MKTTILKALRESGGDYLSGQTLSEALGVSRTAVWKAIGGLREEGYEIESHRRLGYRLMETAPRLTEEDLALALRPMGIETIRYRETLTSTNDEAKALAASGADLPGVVVSIEQTSGRGRRGRQWLSPKGDGLYISFFLAPEIAPERAASLTHLAAYAVNGALAHLIDREVGIKWPNDLVIGGKKVVGILTELSAEVGSLNYVVVGIGLNLKQTTFPEALREQATSLVLEGIEPPDGIELAREISARFLDAVHLYEETGTLAHVLPALREASVTLGRRVRILRPESTIETKALDLDEEGALVVESPEGGTERIYFGEVSVRGLAGYA